MMTRSERIVSSTYAVRIKLGKRVATPTLQPAHKMDQGMNIVKTFTIAALPPGSYTLEAESAGFKKYRRENLRGG